MAVFQIFLEILELNQLHNRDSQPVYARFNNFLPFSVADQKKNPNAVVTALKYYAASLKEQENAKFMTPNSIYNQSDEDDIDITLEGQIQEHLRSSIAANGRGFILFTGTWMSSGLTPSTSLQVDSNLTSPNSAPNNLKKIPSPPPTMAENKSAPVLTGMSLSLSLLLPCFFQKHLLHPSTLVPAKCPLLHPLLSEPRWSQLTEPF